MRFHLALGVAAVLFTACAHSPKTAEIKVPQDYSDKLHAMVGAELIAESNLHRQPASDNWQLKTLKAELGDLNKVKPGKFEIYVFPKMKATNHKEATDANEVLLGKPLVSEVSVLAVTTCEAFIHKGAFAKFNAKKYFAPQLADNKKNKCAIVEVGSRSMRAVNKSLLRNGDILAKRVYLDGDYNVYGLETDYYARGAKQNEMNLKTVGMKMTAGMSSTSGLDFLPVDLPALGQIEKIDPANAQSVFSSSQKADYTFKADGSLVDRMAIRQIVRLNKNFKVPSCSLKKLSYKDHYRKPVEMYWCEGMPWPQVVDSLQFVAVTQNLSVR